MFRPSLPTLYHDANQSSSLGILIILSFHYPPQEQFFLLSAETGCVAPQV